MQDLITMYNNIPLSLNKSGVEFQNQAINFQKFYNMFSIAAELETFRLSSFPPELLGDRESNVNLIQHIRRQCKGKALDDTDFGLTIKYSEGFIPEGNEYLNSPAGLKAMKKIVTMLGGIKDSLPLE
jgi:hypothetical protein